MTFFALHLLPGYHNRTFTFGYWVSIGGKLARSGRLAVTVDNYLRRISEDEDDFINVCINDLERLFSSGGRLYCHHREFGYSMKLLN